MKMLIADDDIATIEMIERVYDWSKLGIGQILRAYNGAVARELIEREKPDVVLCDIGMPQSSGLDVLKWVHENQVDTEFIFLTCYASFEYARDAVRYGASNYLTKPFAPEELQAVVQEAVARLERRRSTEDSAGRRRFTTNMILNNIYKGGLGTDRERIGQMLRTWDCGFDAPDRFRAVYATADKTQALQHEWRAETFQYAFRHLALEAVADELQMELALDTWEGPYYTILLFLPAERFTEYALAARCEDFVRMCVRHLNCSPVCLIGDVVPFYELHPYCQDMDKMMRKARFLKGRTLLYREQAARKNDCEYNMDRELLQNSLQQKNKPALMDYVGALVNDILQKGTAGDELLHRLHQDLLQAFYAYLQENNIEAHILFRDEPMRELNEQAERSALEMMRFVSSMYDSVLAALESVAAPTGIITSIKQYIREHFRENINREEMAAFVFITPNYLSKLFRSETGMTLREYVNQCRIREAKRLLANTELTISEIALETGFENMSYFSTVFKKACGVGPLAWRNGEREDQNGETV